MTKKQRLQRIVARGETSNHCHVVTGDVDITEEDGSTIITVNENSNASLKHLLEKEYAETGTEIWTKEHEDISLKPGKYKIIQQTEYNPIDKMVVKVTD